MSEITKIRGIATGTPEAQKPSIKGADNAFSDVLNNVLSDAANIQSETAKSIQQVSKLGVENIKVEMAKAGDAMHRMQEAREKLLSAYKLMDNN